MKALDFYTQNTEKSIELVVVSTKDFQLDTFPESIQKEFICQQFNGKLGEIAVLSSDQTYIGQGDATDFEAIAQGVSHLPAGIYHPKKSLSIRAQVVWGLTQYRYCAYKKRDILLRTLVLTADHWLEVTKEAEAIFLVRDLINAPANHMHPEALLKTLSDLAKQFDAQYEEWVGEELLNAHFPAVYAVGAAAQVAPRLGILTWGNPAHVKISLVGKGVCFDSGGLDIKPSSGMRLMKKDMGGAAQVLGLAYWIMSLHLPIHLQVIIPAVENAIGSRAFRPGDILTMRNGLTVEIDNTDAEGRLILADALVKAAEFNPQILLDFATLTGAARVAVGTEISALFSNDDELAQGILQQSQPMHDPVWRMPLYAGYATMNDSSIADLSNSTSSAYAGAITAALFLQRFVRADLKWAHFDVMAWNVSNKPGKPEGGEAMGIQSVFAYLKQLSNL